MKDKLKNVLLECIFSAGELLKRNFGKKQKIYTKTSEIDLVTDTDKKSQEIIIKKIKKNFPSCAVIAEEGQLLHANADYVWLVDPLDGTTNYAHNFPIFCVAIAVRYKDQTILSSIYNPMSEELFFAEKGNGAYLNKKRIYVSKTNKLIKALLATGFPYDVKKGSINFEHFKNFSKKSQGVRRPGSASVDLSYVACGRLDGFWEMKLKPWDIAPGALLIEEAGGKVSNFTGEKIDIYSGEILATNGKIHKQMIDVLNHRNLNKFCC